MDPRIHLLNDLSWSFSGAGPTLYGPSQFSGNQSHTANDFRVIICGAEPEFWPHPVAHPNDCPAIVNYWNNALKAWAHTP